ncbi:DUF596 domain-containing protein [uncultured Neisseria sp.]|uniref:DUF596 domain-containing protein n=1 Tax=uncultured Neisseria sp. TaxID=237778 RepID=UPI0025D0C7F7|nr:DUF596 domain-containing protein [uncultured Neisseria sp.]
MDKKQKFEILDFNLKLSAIFNSYKEYMHIDLQDPNLKDKFCSFLEELIDDGSIRLYDYTNGIGTPLTGTSKEQVQKLKDIWPTLEYAQEVFPEDSWYYLEWLWWDILSTIGLDGIPNIDIYETV